MSDFSPVAWTEGMFLRPQHFQQQDRHFQSSLRQVKHPMNWGLESIDIDESSLKLSQIAINSCKGTFADGTFFNFPVSDIAPNNIDVPVGKQNEIVYLSIPNNKSNSVNISDNTDLAITRYKYVDHNVIDTSVGNDAQEILQVAKINCKIHFESDDRSGYVSLAIAKISKITTDGLVILDDKFIPPLMYVSANNYLLNIVKQITAMINQRAEAIAVRMNRANVASSGIADFLMLQLLNKYQPLLTHYTHDIGHHPEELYREFLSLIGELSTFNSDKLRPEKLNQYQHDNLSLVFQQCLLNLTSSLSLVLEQSAIELKLEKSQYGVYFAVLNDKSLLNRAQFVLALKADVVSDEIRNRIPTQTKIGSVETIRELVNNQLPGIALSALPVAPREIPYHTGYHYFQLDKNSSQWNSLLSSGGLALHFSGNYPELMVELWAINCS